MACLFWRKLVEAAPARLAEARAEHRGELLLRSSWPQDLRREVLNIAKNGESR